MLFLRSYTRFLWIALLLGGFLGFLYASEGKEKLDGMLNAFGGVESLRANLTINGTLSGTLSFKKPNNLHVRFADGRVISANGKTLWFYNPESGIAARQDLKGVSGGIFGLVSGYEDIQATANQIRLKSQTKAYEEIAIQLTESQLPKTIRMKRKSGESTEIVFNSITTGIGLSSDLFNFQPPSSSQIVENPLNQRE